MKHVKALLIKFVMVTAVLWVVLGLFYGVSFNDILGISTFLTLAAYIIGDLWILPRFGNAVATIADFGLAYLGVWLLGGGYIEENIPLGLASLYAAIGITIGEYFFHRYMENEILPDQGQPENEPVRQNNYVTEFSEEPNPDLNNNRDKQ
ncbi:YndM family protein [Alkalihalobacillus sp. TS-13]|uniref:YndM family protein n=1 Tax=Alkalihalobacillus sp. TS-13 TaxID=2842455 RepID=UPI001C87FFF9|nr:YndM family protein [Alkalihalobacillus sp. TS-13]